MFDLKQRLTLRTIDDLHKEAELIEKNQLA